MDTITVRKARVDLGLSNAGSIMVELVASGWFAALDATGFVMAVSSQNGGAFQANASEQGWKIVQLRSEVEFTLLDVKRNGRPVLVFGREMVSADRAKIETLARVLGGPASDWTLVSRTDDSAWVPVTNEPVTVVEPEQGLGLETPADPGAIELRAYDVLEVNRNGRWLDFSTIRADDFADVRRILRAGFDGTPAESFRVRRGFNW